MPNTLTSIMPKILARGLMALREQCIMPRLVNGDYSETPAEKGSTIDVPVPTAQTATDVTPANTPPQAPDTAPKTVQVILSNWKKTNFYLTDKDMGDIDRDQAFLPMQVMESIRALSNAVNLTLYNQYVNIYGYTGTAGTTPFGTANTITDATNVRRILHKQRAPRTDRRAVLNFDAEANALTQAPFSNFEQSGDQAVKIEGQVGRKFGIDWYADDQVVTHPGGAQTGTVTVNGAHAVPATSGQYGYNDQQTVSIATAGGSSFAPIAGDILTFAGDLQTYTVVTPVTLGASATGNIVIMPGFRLLKAGGEAVTMKAAHVVNLGFHRDCFAFANRPLVLSSTDYALGSQILPLTDLQTGISLRLEVSRQYKQVMWEFDILWGAKLVRPELGTRLAG